MQLKFYSGTSYVEYCVMTEWFSNAHYIRMNGQLQTWWNLRSEIKAASCIGYNVASVEKAQYN